MLIRFGTIYRVVQYRLGESALPISFSDAQNMPFPRQEEPDPKKKKRVPENLRSVFLHCWQTNLPPDTKVVNCSNNIDILYVDAHGEPDANGLTDVRRFSRETSGKSMAERAPIIAAFEAKATPAEAICTVDPTRDETTGRYFRVGKVQPLPLENSV